MYLHSYFGVCIVFLSAWLSLGLQIAATSPNGQIEATPTPTPISRLWRRGILQDLWNGVSNRVGQGPAQGFPFDFSRPAVYAPSSFSGCTVVIIASGKGVAIGHFSEGRGGPVKCMEDKAKIDHMVEELGGSALEANIEEDPKNARAWIILSHVINDDSPGYKSIIAKLNGELEIPMDNISKIRYSAGSGTGEGAGDLDKAVVQWTPKADGSGGTLNVYIRSDTPKFTSDYNCDRQPVGNRKNKRDAPACTPTKSAPSTITSGPLCTYVGPEPPTVPEAFCSCAGSSYPLSSTTGPAVKQSDSCSYKALPTAPATTFRNVPVTTDSAACKVCTAYAANEGDCSPIPSCGAQVTVQAGSSPVHVGTLTSTALYTSISSALNKLCPTVSQTTGMTACSTDAVKIPDIDYVHEGIVMTGGELQIRVESSAYNITSLRDAMIKSAATTAQMSSQNKKNCYTSRYTDRPPKKLKRSLLPFLDPVTNLFGLEKRANYDPVGAHVETEWCNIASFAGVQYFNQYWRQAPQAGASDYIDVGWTFDTGPEQAFECAFLAELTDALAVIQPEFAVGDIGLGEAIMVGCEVAMEHGH